MIVDRTPKENSKEKIHENTSQTKLYQHLEFGKVNLKKEYNNKYI